MKTSIKNNWAISSFKGVEPGTIAAEVGVILFIALSFGIAIFLG